MLKGRGRDPRAAVPPTPTLSIRSVGRPPLARPEPDYEIVEFPAEQYVNAKLQPPPPPPPRPQTGHPTEAGASCGLCGGGGARVRCAECGRRALCASCDDMYHRHPKRRHHQRQALSQSQLLDERPPLPPKTGPPVPPPRKHKISGDRLSASPRLPTPDQRRATLTSISTNDMVVLGDPAAANPNHLSSRAMAHSQMTAPSPRLGSMPYLSATMQHAQPPAAPSHDQANTLGHVPNAWGRQRTSLPGFMPPNIVQPMPMGTWEGSNGPHPTQSWSRPLRRGGSVMELGVGVGAGVGPQASPGGPACAGCPHCLAQPWRYGSCASLDHGWAGHPAWPHSYCPPAPPHAAPHPAHTHAHQHPSQTPQPYRRAESRAVSRAGSRAGSRAPSPAMSVRSRTSRRPRHRTPSPPPLPSSDADSESESESDHPPAKEPEDEEDPLGPPPSPPSAPWQCEHCTFVNEPGVRVCVVCCRTPTVSARIIDPSTVQNDMMKLKISGDKAPSVVRANGDGTISKHAKDKTKTKKERTSTACGPSPPREDRASRTPLSRLTTPARDDARPAAQTRTRHDMAVGPSPPKETQTAPNMTLMATVRPSPIRSSTPREYKTEKHSVSVGPSPPRDVKGSTYHTQTSSQNSTGIQKKSTGTSPPRETRIDTPSSLLSSTSSRANVSNTGTSPPPQSISTQTYEVTEVREWERAPSVSGTRARRRYREEGPRERSHSRHSLSSDTRDSERSVRTSGGGGGGGATLGPGRWEWRERDREPRDSSPGGEWSGSERRRATRLTRRASHLDLRRSRPSRRSSVYGSEAPSPEPFTGNRAVSLEALAGAGARRETERGLELARLMGEAEKLGFSAAEVHAALAQNPAAPITWLRERWPSLCAGVRAAAVRLAPGAVISERDARTALARHRGAMWPAVTDCVEKWRRQTESLGLGSEGRLRGHVWGSPTGVDDDAAPPLDRSHRIRAEESSDEYEISPAVIQDDDWMYLPLETANNSFYEHYPTKEQIDSPNVETEDIAQKLKSLLIQAGIPNINEQLLLKGLLANHRNTETDMNIGPQNADINQKQNSNDFVQSENDFIDAYNALTRLSPLPNINKPNDNMHTKHESETIKESESIIKEQGKTHDTNESNKLRQNTNSIPSSSQKIKTQITTQTQSLTEENQNGTVDKIPQHKHVTKPNSQSKGKTSKSPKRTTAKQNQRLKKKLESSDSETREDEEKPNNLSDMVDNTQRLIQQMKNELNSDMNSLDSRSNSGSENDLSTNDSELSSEKESSYNKSSESESEDMSSDDSEGVKSNTENNNLVKTTTVTRTSSEDNEQFEEAIDHLDIEIENPVRQSENLENQDLNFQLRNIEILDSIAKSLQEEYSTVKKEQINIPHNDRQDFNNNLFNTVNSFEEIYEQLTEKNNATNVKTQPPTVSTENNNTTFYSVIQKPKYNKGEVKFVSFNPQTPHVYLLSENTIMLHNAIIEDIINEIEIEGNDSLESIDPSQSIDSNEEQSENNFIEPKIQPHNNIAINNNSKSLENITENMITSSDSVENTSISTPTSTVIATNEEREDQETDSHSNIQENSAATDNLDKESAQHSKVNYSESTTKNDKSVINTKPSKEGLQVKTTSNKGIFNKSNIPKLVKALQNNKLKVEKTTPKVLGSKVPIRRTSIKHYPAPAPPNGHFGNVQNGNVKQLQTKLFNNKAQNSKNVSSEVEVKPSTSATSTLSKKKPAPLPPTTVERKLETPTEEEQDKEKKHYFRETCRTEDEWTDSDGEEPQMPVTKETNEPEAAPVSPPPPITMRRVSGQLVDLATIRLPEGSPERQARMLLAEGATENWEQAQLAVELITRGINPPSALLAALECVDLDSALAYLQQDCELCASRLPEYEMVSMLRCTHRCCRECARHYFTVQITERSIADCVCPYCKEPELENLPEDEWLEYFAHLDILLKTLLNTDVHELFQRKLRDRTLARDPNFKWCVECSSGFFVHPKQKKLRCPECRSVSCASCRKPWSPNHEGLTCEQYTKWLDDNDPERSVAAVQQHLRENGLECPRCHFKYSLSRGGCMHFTCTQCKYEFCYGCGKPFMMGARCGLSEYCAKLGLHAHHPRNCLFYLRDKEPHELQTLLQMNNVTYETEPGPGSTGRCPVQLQRETPTGLVDGACGSESSPNNAGLCKNHYLEYLSRLVRGRAVDPLPILGVDDLETLVRRAALRLPPRPYGTLEGLYKRGLIEIVREKIPLD